MKRIAVRSLRCRGRALLAVLLLGACSYTDWRLPQSNAPVAAGNSGDAEIGGASATGGLARPELQGGAGAAGLDEDDGAGIAEPGAGASGQAGARGVGAGGEPQADAGAAGALPDPECDSSAEFGAPTPVPFASFRDRVDGRLSSDETTLYFGSLGDIWVATRADRKAQFDDEQVLLHDPFLVHVTPSLTRDGLSLYYAVLHASDDADAKLPAEGLYVSRRTTVHDTFGTGSYLSEFPAGAGSSFITPAGRGLYFVMNDDLFQSTLGRLGFAQFLQLKTLDGGGAYSYETLPLVSDDERTIYFASLRNGIDFDIWRATRSDPTRDFLPPSRVDALNGPTNDYPNWMSPDGCRIYLHRYADTSWHGPQLMVASKPKLASH